MGLCYLLLGSIAKAQAPFSWDNATVYFLLTDRFHNGNPANDLSYGRTADAVGGFLGGDLAGLTAKINDNYFNNLGVNALWITAPYEQIHGAVPGYWLPSGYPGGQHYAYHGYYPLDWTEMDANLGTKTDFQAMIDAAHAKGIRVLIDIVVNHTGYETVLDSQTYGFGTLGDPWTVPNTGLDVNNVSWCNWWVDNNGVSWIRKGDTNTDYCSPACGGGDLAMCLAGLPDVRTDLTTAVGLPKILQNKWDATKEAQEVAELDAFFAANPTYPRTPANYIIKWLTDWVREFGIDGFRIDTYKHVETPVWGRLKDQAQIAFNDWKTANPTKKLDDTPFWMVGELFGAGITKNTDAVTNGKTDALINFNFQGGTYAPNTLDAIYTSYAAATNNDPTWNFLSYISSHDKDMYDRANLTAAGTALLLAPGAVQIYYGDETARPKGTTGTDQDSRTYMNWGSINTTLQAHWQKIGQFRQNHLAVGAGQHQKLADSPYTFRRTYNSATACDAVVVVLGASGSTTVTVSSVFENGVQLRDAYTGNTATVSGGSVTFAAHTNGVILIERVVAAPCPPTACITATPTSGAAPLVVNFSAACSSSPSGTTISSYAWNFGDGNTATGATPSHTFTANGTYTVTLTVTNNAMQTASTTTSITVGTNIIKVFFQKPSGWPAGTPKMYYWNIVPAGALPTVSWNDSPAMTDEGNGWFSYTFPANVTSANLIFRDAISGSSKTADLSTTKSGWYPDCLAGWVYTDPRSLTATNYDVFFENTANWPQPKIYYWNLEPATAGPAPVGWSGSNMTLVSGNKWKFSFTGARKACVIFNNGGGVQSRDLLSIAAGGTYNFGTGLWTLCPVDVQLNGTLTNGTYPSGNTIDAINNISSGTNIIFDAKNAVTLSPGFQAQTGSVFMAKIGGCN